MSVDATSSTTAAPAQPQADQKPQSKSSDWDFSFHNLLDIINPLEHLPIIGTIYRAITHTHIGIPERIAGDALYGGLWGAVSGAADAAFEAITGKDFGSTVLALFTGHHHSTAVAANTANSANTANIDIGTVTVTPAKQLASMPSVGTVDSPDIVALEASMSRNGIDNDLAQRALAAYRKSMLLPAMAALPAS
ncbi:MAG TPA: hypothetical protein VGI89_12205 [Rhizomicrobium sp.]